MPQSQAERQLLLDRMIAAQPDEANPFRSHKARARRARLIMQWMDSPARESRDPQFDLSAYTRHWNDGQVTQTPRVPAMA